MGDGYGYDGPNVVFKRASTVLHCGSMSLVVIVYG